MSNDHNQSSKPDKKVPEDAAPHNPGLSPKPSEPSAATKPAEGGPYDKKADPEQQPS